MAFEINFQSIVGIHEDDSQQRSDIFIKRLEELEASLEKQNARIKNFAPSVPMIGGGVTAKNPSNRSTSDDNVDDLESMDADVTGNSGSEVTEVMVDLDDSTAEAPFDGR